MVLNRLKPRTEKLPPETQSGLCLGRSTLDTMFVLRQRQQKCRELRQDLHLVFIDLVKIFDSVDRDLTWRLLEKSGVPSKLVNLIRSFHVGMQAKVSINGETTALTTSSTSGSTAILDGSLWDPIDDITVLIKVLKCSSQQLRTSSHWVRQLRVVEFMG